MGVSIGALNRRIRIEKPVPDTSLTGAGSGTWELLGEAWASVEDVLPNRAERLADGLNIATRPARVRLRYRDDVTPSMRFVMGDRVMQIIAEPAEIGFRDALEFMVEDYSSAGTGA